ncbi:hypothetical protein VTJ83DRAFT_1736 [Remersonia thermophila]|uniref:SET domain-containing protein n=1 Tax=Remersonia thermophila TaxID=72144 RepID=A0ABR4DJ35_9PEZI
MEVYDELLRWAQDRGVELHGVAPRTIPGRGVGLIATKPLKANELVMHIPNSALRSIATVRPRIKKTLPEGTKVHALLAAELALDKPTSKHAPWNAVIPSRSDMTSSLPLAWPDPRLHAYLPPKARALLKQQAAKFERDWAVVAGSSSPALGHLTRDEYLYFWLLVNTRTFYHETPRTKQRLPHDDRMALQPVADLFNHADEPGCDVAFGAPGGGFEVTVGEGRAFQPGDELCICYGRHSNDFLLVEYGFVLQKNRWDEASLDDALLPELGPEQREALDARGFLGGYVLDAETACYRTQVALRLLCARSVEEWGALVDEGEDGGDEMQRKTDRLLLKILKKHRKTVQRTIEELGALDMGEQCQRDVLVTRWKQIQVLIDRAIQRLGS